MTWKYRWKASSDRIYVRREYITGPLGWMLITANHNSLHHSLRIFWTSRPFLRLDSPSKVNLISTFMLQNKVWEMQVVHRMNVSCSQILQIKKRKGIDNWVYTVAFNSGLERPRWMLSPILLSSGIQEPADPRQLCLHSQPKSQYWEKERQCNSLEKLAADLKWQVKRICLPALKHWDSIKTSQCSSGITT